MAIEINIESQIQPFDNVAEFPAAGAEKTIYIAKDINAAYYWNGSAYILIVDPTEVIWGDITGDLLNQTDLIGALDLKVDKVAGKGLSEEDYTTAEKSKLAGIEAGAEVNVNADWNAVSGDAQILNKPDLSTYATDSELVAGLATKENIITAGTTSQYFRGDKTFQTLDKTAVGLENVDNTSDANKPISTATLTALNAKQNNAIIHRNFTQGANVTGTTSEVQVFQLLIPANTFSATDKLAFFAVLSRVTASTLVSLRAKISTSATMPSGATGMIARLNPAVLNVYAKISREMIISGGNVRGVNNNTPLTFDTTTSTSLMSSQAMDVTVDNYFYLSVQLTAATDDVRLEAVEIKTI
jgi:hypothetical protein